LANSRWGIVVISPYFIAKKWPRRELAGLVNVQTSESDDVILPIWHGVTKDQVLAFSPPLVDLVASDKALMSADEIARRLNM
jgi:hypothetical protein